MGVLPREGVEVGGGVQLAHGRGHEVRRSLRVGVASLAALEAVLVPGGAVGHAVGGDGGGDVGVGRVRRL